MGIRQMLLSGQTGNVVNPMTGASTYDDTGAGTRSVDVRIYEDGTVRTAKQGQGPVIQGAWYSPTTANIGVGFYVRCNVTNGAITTSSSDSINVWINIGTSYKHWAVVDNGGPSSTSADITIEIATDSGGTNIVTSGNFTITADSTNP